MQGHPTAPQLNTSFTNIRPSFRDDTDYRAAAAERDQRRKYAEILKRENEEYDSRMKLEAAKLNEESGVYFRAFHEEQNPYERERYAVEYARRRGIVKMGYEFSHFAGSREKTMAELSSVRLARLWFPAVVPALAKKRLAEL